MENSEQSEKIIALGKLLVNDLGLEPGVDTLARWMAHYLAEKISQVESLPDGKEKAEVAKECCDIILKIWDHRSKMPSGRRPFENFEPILKVLDSIDPDKDEPYFHHMSRHELTQLEKTNPNYNEIKPYIEAVVELEKVVRIWMESLLNQAALKVSDEKTKTWLRAASELSLSEDVLAIRIVHSRFNLLSEEDDSESQDDETTSKDIKRLENRVEQLGKFMKLSEQLLKIYQDELVERKRPKSEGKDTD